MRFLTCEGGIRKEEVVAKGEGEVLKGDVGIRKEEVVRFAQFRSFDVLKYFIHLTFNLAEGDHFLIPPSSILLPPELRLWRFVLLVDGVVGELAEVRQSGDLVAGELTRGAGTEIHTLHVGGNGEVLGRVGRGGADTGGEDAEVRNLHRLTLQHQLADTGDHVGEHPLDDTLGIGRGVLSHVLGKVFQRHGLTHHG